MTQQTLENNVKCIQTKLKRMINLMKSDEILAIGFHKF